jgi:hypothetical protein
MTPEQSKLLAEYQTAKAAFDAAKLCEQNLRKQVVASLGDPRKEEGTERVYLEEVGLEAVMGKRLNYKVDNAKARELELMMPKESFEDLFKVSIELSITAYRKLTPPQKVFVDYALTITDGMPTLKLEETKKVI